MESDESSSGFEAGFSANDSEVIRSTRRRRRIDKKKFAVQLLLVYAILMVLALVGMGVTFIGMWGMDDTVWFHPKCNHLCTTKQLKGRTPPLLLISLSGFSRDYLDHVKMLTLERMRICGATAERVIPSFPLKTYPNHATIVTGFYPGIHGVDADKTFVWDSNEIFQSYKSNMSKEHFVEEPIWALLRRVKQGKTASLFWPGPFARVSHYAQPAYHVNVDPTVPDSEQFDQIVRWLEMPPRDRPGLIMVHLDYLKQIAIHHKDEQQIYTMMKKLDALLGRLFTKLHREKFLHCLNVAVVSDGGIIRRGAKILLFEKQGSRWFVNSGPITTLHLKPDSKGMINGNVAVKEFHCSDEELFVHTRKSQPPRWYYKYSQMSGEVILVGRDGTNIYAHKDDDDVNEGAGNYGGDYTNPSTHTIFFAMGPSVKKGVTLPPIQNVEFMNLWAALLEVDCAENDGDKYIMERILKRHPSDRPKTEYVPNCYNTPIGDITICGDCKEDDHEKLKKWLAQCKDTSPIMKLIKRTEEEEMLCYMPLCNEGIVTNIRGNIRSIIEVYHVWKVDGNAPHMNCPYVTQPFNEACPAIYNSSTVQTTSLSAYGDKGAANHQASVVPMRKGFIKTYFEPLNAYTKLVAGKMRKIISITGAIGDKSQYLPEHIYRILITCPNGWAQNGLHCQKHSEMDVLSFLFPHLNEDINCLDRSNLLLHYSARMKDIEILAGYSFHLQNVPEAEMTRLRIHTPYKLW